MRKDSFGSFSHQLEKMNRNYSIIIPSKKTKNPDPPELYPTTPGRLELIEQQFEEEGIPVVWHDESVEERKARLVTSPLV